MRSPARAKQSQETCPNAESSFGHFAQRVFRPQWEFSLSRKIPSPACCVLRKGRGGGILIFQHRSNCDWRFCIRSPRSGRTSTKGAGLFSFVRRADSNTNHRLTKMSMIVLFAVIAVGSCSPSHNQNSVHSTGPLREITDEAGRRVHLPLLIDRIVSLAPNLTDLVYAVGAGERLVGDTTYCDYPPEAKNVAKVGDTMQPSIERIVALKPQIVLVSTASQLEAFTKQLDEQNIAVYVTNPQSLDDVFRSIQTLGDLFGHHDWTATMVAELRQRAAAVEAAVKQVKSVTV